MRPFWGWAGMRPTARDAHRASAGGRAASHTKRERQVGRTTPPATSPFPSLSSASRIERARSRLQAREFRKAGQRIWESSCKLGTFVCTHCPEVPKDTNCLVSFSFTWAGIRKQLINLISKFLCNSLIGNRSEYKLSGNICDCLSS